MPGLRGVITPLLTPLDDDGNIDGDGLKRLLEMQMAAGVHGIFLAGTTGEGLALNLTQRDLLVELTCDHTKDRMAIIVDVGAGCLEDAVRHAGVARQCGAWAVALQPPAYFPLESADLQAFYLQFLRQAQFRTFLYHIPSNTTGIPLELVEELAGGEQIAGIKESSSDPEYLRKLLTLCQSPSFAVYVGDQLRMGEALRQGVDGIVPGIANVEPRRCVELVEAVWMEDWVRYEEINGELIAKTHEMRTEPFSAMIRSMKRKLVGMGIIGSERMSSIFQNEPMSETVPMGKRA